MKKLKSGPFLARPWAPPGRGYAVTNDHGQGELEIANEDAEELIALGHKMLSDRPRLRMKRRNK